MNKFTYTILLILTRCLQNSLATTGLVCHDCTGNAECDDLLKNERTGKCRTQFPGKCFIRQDPNGILYRGCADGLNFPQLDFSYSGCRYQSYGWWSTTPVFWCFCDSDLCNIDIGYLQSGTQGQSYSQAQSGIQVQTGAQGQSNLQAGYWQIGQNQGRQGQIIQSNAGQRPVPNIQANYGFSQQASYDIGTLGQNIENGGQSAYEANGNGGNIGKELQGDVGGGSERFSDWDAVQRYLQQQGSVRGDQSAVNLPPIVSRPMSRKYSKSKPAHLPPILAPVAPVYPSYFPPLLITTLIPPYNPQIPPRIPPRLPPPQIQQPPFDIPFAQTTPPALGITTTTLSWIGNATSSQFALPTTAPVRETVTQPGPLYRLPDELLQYLLRNLPRNANDVQTLPYPVYLILYILSSSGVNLATIPGLNVTGLNISTLPGIPASDVPGGNYSLGCMVTGCEQYCEFVLNQAQCRCRPGFLLNNDLRTCGDIDECSVNNGGCSQLCFNTIGSFFCDCQSNYQLGSDQRTCQDINECNFRNGGCSDTCRNLPGTYTCSCPSGSFLGLDNRTCSNSVGQCNSNQQQGCPQICQLVGSAATCSCYQGYVLNGATCNDINECSDGTSSCNQTCVNTPGSYSCACAPGYRLASDLKQCIDQNECLQNNGGCKQTCTNTPGSFYCSCEVGFVLDADRITCDDVNECVMNNGGCSQNCTNLPGSFICSCRSNLYQLQPDGKTCTGACPLDFIKNDAIGSCYKIFTSIQLADARPVASARDYCRQLHPLANLVSIETLAEKFYLQQLLSREPVMLEGWQGWWTSGYYRSGINQFYWGTGGVIPNSADFWGFQRPPFADTCVWILQIPNYNYTLGNYDCYTSSGFICEITYLDLVNDP